MNKVKPVTPLPVTKIYIVGHDSDGNAAWWPKWQLTHAVWPYLRAATPEEHLLMKACENGTDTNETRRQLNELIRNR